MHLLKQLFTAGLVATALGVGLGAAILPSAPAHAEDIVRVVDAQGHQIGILIRSPQMPATIPSSPSVFEAMDRMMAQQMAAMQAEQNRLIEAVDHMQTPAAGAPGNSGSAYQSFTSVSWSANGQNCSETVTSTRNGEAKPIIHVSSSGNSSSCHHSVSGAMTPPLHSENAASTDLVPAVDTGSPQHKTAPASRM